jgi:hypothetical protein
MTKFQIDGKPVAGLLMNSRMVQAIFDDENPDFERLSEITGG